MVIALAIIVIGIGSYIAINKASTSKLYTTSSQTAQPTSTQTITSNLINVRPLLPYINTSLVPSYGSNSSKYYLFIVYDPECPYCAIEFNSTLPYLKYLARNNYAKLVFIGMPIHQYSLEMIAMLDLLYQKYGFTQFYNVLEKDYAIYYYNIMLYENNKTSQLEMPTPYTLYLIFNQSNLSINYNNINSTMKNAYAIANLAYNQGIDATPILIIYNVQTGSTVNQFVGLYPTQEIESYLNQTLGVRS
ncbi:hypothetical protein [Caldisphaera sp.]|uniref:hypothetical protein n=1 Tax=Caldisphaera sp. TaxID=2060322 RepID=UPI0025B7E436|nr:hypothetical protein [Caldisphaera sp.]